MECPVCHVPAQPGDRFCGSCGERLGGEAAPAPNAAPAGGSSAFPAPPAFTPAPSDFGAATQYFPGGSVPSPGVGLPAAPPPAPAWGAPAGSGLPAPASGGVAGSPGSGQSAAPSPFGATQFLDDLSRSSASDGPMSPVGENGNFHCPVCSAPVGEGDTSCLVCATPFAARPAARVSAPPAPPSFPPAPAPSAPAAWGGTSAPLSPPSRPVMESPASPLQQSAPPIQEFPPRTEPAAPVMQPVPAAVGFERGPAPAVCAIHGEMDPTWSRCPQCLREGREGRLQTQSGHIFPPPPALAGEQSPAINPPLMERPAPSAPPPPAPAPAPAAPVVAELAPPVTAAPEPAAPPPAPSAPASERALPRQPSSVGATVVIGRRSRGLAFLIEKEGDQVGRVFQLEQRDPTNIGRDPLNTVVVNDPLVSGFHARLDPMGDGRYVYTDRGSTNGSRLNGEPVTQPRVLAEDDEIGIGGTTLVLKLVK